MFETGNVCAQIVVSHKLRGRAVFVFSLSERKKSGRVVAAEVSSIRERHHPLYKIPFNRTKHGDTKDTCNVPPRETFFIHVNNEDQKPKGHAVN